MKITVETVMALRPCEYWSEDRVRAILGDGLDARDGLEAILALKFADARWLLARLLSQENRVMWAEAAAKRAKGYADALASAATRAGYAADHADRAAAAADWAAADAIYHAVHAAGAAGAANAAAEHRLACEHALSLLSNQR